MQNCTVLGVGCLHFSYTFCLLSTNKALPSTVSVIQTWGGSVFQRKSIRVKHLKFTITLKWLMPYVVSFKSWVPSCMHLFCWKVIIKHLCQFPNWFQRWSQCFKVHYTLRCATESFQSRGAFTVLLQRC